MNVLFWQKKRKFLIWPITPRVFRWQRRRWQDDVSDALKKGVAGGWQGYSVLSAVWDILFPVSVWIMLVGGSGGAPLWLIIFVVLAGASFNAVVTRIIGRK